MPRHSSALGQADPGQSPAPRLGALPWPPKARSCWVSPFFSFPHPGASCGASQTLNNSRDTPRAEAGTTPRYNQAKRGAVPQVPLSPAPAPPHPGASMRGRRRRLLCPHSACRARGGGSAQPQPDPWGRQAGPAPRRGPGGGSPAGQCPLPTPPSCSRLPVPGGQRLPSAPPPG